MKDGLGERSGFFYVRVDARIFDAHAARMLARVVADMRSGSLAGGLLIGLIASAYIARSVASGKKRAGAGGGRV